ncbi:NAD(P)H-hydrate dehydratase [Aurantimonas sp. C2-6-R+9]|uniref:NAD(P)H-hydrate dehydratase n=1 Tax=unclassified Aurantimonas TaxID=2638230 RepID=UPI002E17A022|nr:MULTISPECIES: NAD(P)H-hydrate dehydratase [unclassified Aurantimonas]MEC5290252.1 NAD(P)H-hydrate dehydratase [Aurantimonas sp. C2-3-R2]MEC5380363.1 NAD(P)H-hydrate dehydratase [Aurantimonas sp. C2-6-R+9]MEC5411316.1 NAD(P)H-hydrate dehydratase [Aurantimonas sp. C2-4-R8]
MVFQDACGTALLTPDEMAEADRRTIAAGTPGIALMERAAESVAAAVHSHYPRAERIALLAGPGNNGGDAYAAARLLGEAGRRVEIFGLVAATKLHGDAAIAATAFGGTTHPLDSFDPAAFDLVIDGLFGAGLSRPVEGGAAGVIRKLNAAPTPVVAIDLPSGVSGATGERLGEAVSADLTVTFFRRKPGHLLEPGRSLCGPTIVADIGIPATVLDAIAPMIFANEPALWMDALKRPPIAGHKYDRGHAVVFSGGATRTGAARLAATAALRGGAGLVTIFSPGAALMANAAHLTAIMLRRCDDEAALGERLEDSRFNAFVLGPGFGVGERARCFASAVLAAGRRLVLDADGITAFADDPDTLFAAARAGGKGASALVLTPHDGEFKRLFPDIADRHASKLERARVAATRAGAIIVLKGRDTVIAAPDGRAAINATGTPWLATAGTGDVLAGLVAAQLAQGTPSFEAACAAVWMHGRAAELFGPGLISEDLPAMLPKVHRQLEALASNPRA